jgi:hypothetical protein
MTKHSTLKYQAMKAYDIIHIEEHQHVERQRREVLQQITGASGAQDRLVKELS